MQRKERDAWDEESGCGGRGDNLGHGLQVVLMTC